MGTPNFPESVKHLPKTSLGIYGRLILLLLIVLIPILLIQTLIYYERFQTRKANELQANLEVARAVGRAFGAFLEDVLHHELAIGIAATSSSPLSDDDMNRLLEAGATDHSAISSLSWVEPNGRVLNASKPEARGLDISDRPFFREIVSGREWVVSDLVVSKVDGQPLFLISRGVRDRGGNLQGIVVAAILPDRLDSVLAIERAKGGGVSLMDSKGMLVYRFPHVQVSWEERNWAERVGTFREALEGTEAAELIPSANSDGRSRFIAAVPIRSIGWVASAGRREEDAVEAIISGLIRDGSMFLSIALASFLAALFVSRTIAAPIKALQEHAHRFRQGMPDSHVKPTGPREVRRLALSLNHMADEIRHWMEETRAQAQMVEQKASEAEEGRRLLHALMEHVPEGITIADALDLRIRMVSRYGRDMLGEAQDGLTVAELAGQWKVYSENCMTPMAPEELPLSRAIQRGETVKNAEIICVNAKGEHLSLLCNAGPLRDSSGCIFGGIVAWRDVTEMRRVQDALRESEHRYRTLFETMSEGFALHEIIYDGEGRPCDHRILEANPAFERQIGFRAEDLVGRTLREVFPEAEDVWIERYGRVALTGEPDHFEQWAKCLGRCFDVCAFRTGSGRFATVLLDITERKRAEEELRDLSERLSYHVANSPLAAIEWGPDMRLIRWSGAAERIFGWSAEEVIGKRIEDFRWVYEEDEAQVTEISFNLSRGVNPQRFSANRNYRKDGSVIECEWYNSSLMDESGKLRSILSLVLDVTERKRLEKELREARDLLELRVQERTAELMGANTALRESESELRLLSSKLLSAQEEERKRIAHELHDSIGASLGAIKFNLVNTLDAVQEGAAVQESIQDLISLVEHTVEDARRIYTNLRPSILDHLGIIPTIGWYCRQFESAYTAIRIEKHIEVEEEQIPDSIKIVIFRVLQESFHNIAKYSRADCVCLSLTEASGSTELAVSDNGVGFDVNAALTLRREKGGLGLTSMRERVQLSGGTFAIESANGEGTTIHASWDQSKLMQ